MMFLCLGIEVQKVSKSVQNTGGIVGAFFGGALLVLVVGGVLFVIFKRKGKFIYYC